MSATTIEKKLRDLLSGLDEDILSYVVSVLEDMPAKDLLNPTTVAEAVGPFLLDSGHCSTEADVDALCSKICATAPASTNKTEEEPTIFATAFKMKTIEIKNPEALLHSSQVEKEKSGSATAGFGLVSMAELEEKKENEKKDARKQKKEQSAQQRAAEKEALARQLKLNEMKVARMAAIKASRGFARQASQAVILDKFTVPHPAGQGDILAESNITLVPRHRYGFIGKNGIGKSTLMNYLAGYKTPQITHLRINLVDQHIEGDDRSPLQWILDSDLERSYLLEQETLLTHLQLVDNLEEIPEEFKGQDISLLLSECYERMEVINVATADSRARKVLHGLGFSETQMVVPTNRLSGGWAVRAAVASAVYTKPDLLLLDEPTNHLDVHAMVWLETWLSEHYQGVCLIVSHDTVFLNNVCTDILEMRPAPGSASSTAVGNRSTVAIIEQFQGDYKSFCNIIEERKIFNERASVAHEKEKEKLKEFIAREGRKYDNPAHQAQRKMKMKQLAELEAQEMSLGFMEAQAEKNDSTLRFPEPYAVFSEFEPLITLQDVSFSYDGVAANNLFEHVEFNVNTKTRLALVGKNGCGKTSLLNILVGITNPTEGNCIINMASRITLLQQHHYKGEQLNPDLTPLEHLRQLPTDANTAVGILDKGSRQEETSLRSYLANFGLSSWRASVPVKHMSGGQRMRLAMAVVMFNRPDCLILDEPTNHLDAETVDSLAQAISHFHGAVIVVSHDEEFINCILSGGESEKKDDSNSDSKGKGGGKDSSSSSSGGGNSKSSKGGSLEAKMPTGDILYFQGNSLKRFDGSFSEYKKNILKKMLVQVDNFNF